MKSTGIVRKIDNLGRLVIPKELRRIFGLDAQQGMEIYVDGESIIISKHQDKCVICDCKEGLAIFGSKLICHGCISRLGQVC